MIEGKKILIGVTGSIAAYKIAILVRLLIKEGAAVKVIMTPSSKSFVSALTLSTLSKNPVLSDLAENESWANHVMLGRWADVMLIAPLSCNTLGKMATGMCDNLLLAVYLSAVCPVIVAPAMDEDMWHHPSTRKNIETLKHFGNRILPVDNEELASGLIGEGRMAEPEAMVNYLHNFFSEHDQLTGKKVLITAGPTYESIDPVRFIGNHSSGKMGIALADGFQQRGAEVTLVMGPTSQPLPPVSKILKVKSAQEMYDAVIENFAQTDIAVMAAAVADYRIDYPAKEKIKKTSDTLTLQLQKTPDILKAIGFAKQQHQIVVGFALETTNERENAIKKLQSKNADFIVLNSLNDEGAGFGMDTNKITIFHKHGGHKEFGISSKKQVAADIINTIITV